MITVQVWDKGLVKAVEKAIRDSDLGVNPATDGNVVRVVLPQLTEERRKELDYDVAQARLAKAGCPAPKCAVPPSPASLPEDGQAGAVSPLTPPSHLAASAIRAGLALR